LACSSSELNIDVCLLNGQSFRFTKVQSETSDFPTIYGVAQNRVWKFGRINEQTISYEVLARFDEATAAEDELILRNYFQLDVDLLELYDEWSLKDANFKTQLEKNFNHLTGIRVLRQDVLETFFAFMCSSNNHIDRIKGMVNSICELYGERVDVEIDGEPQSFYNFPTLESLFENREGMEDEFKERKFGYRAAWIVKAVEKLTELGGRQWLEGLKALPYKKASGLLIKNFVGIGKKIADCISLMALEMNEVVPIDTHIFRISLTNYLPSLPNEYNKCGVKHFEQIQTFWSERFGAYAGWAQTTLFTNELRSFKQKQPTKRKRKTI